MEGSVGASPASLVSLFVVLQVYEGDPCRHFGSDNNYCYVWLFVDKNDLWCYYYINSWELRLFCYWFKNIMKWLDLFFRWSCMHIWFILETWHLLCSWFTAWHMVLENIARHKQITNEVKHITFYPCGPN